MGPKWNTYSILDATEMLHLKKLVKIPQCIFDIYTMVFIRYFYCESIQKCVITMQCLSRTEWPLSVLFIFSVPDTQSGYTAYWIVQKSWHYVFTFNRITDFRSQKNYEEGGGGEKEKKKERKKKKKIKGVMAYFYRKLHTTREMIRTYSVCISSFNLHKVCV